MVYKKIETPIGEMIAMATDEGLCMLEFADKKGVDQEMQVLVKAVGEVASFAEDSHPILIRLEEELQSYFNGNLDSFTVPLAPIGTPFQKSVWEALQTIAYGDTCSYGFIARQIENPKGVRAIGLANGRNHIAIVIPCHRVIGANGKLTGYAGGLWRKEWLLEHERKYQPYLENGKFTV